MMRDGMCSFELPNGKYCPAFAETDGLCEYHWSYENNLRLPYGEKSRQQQGRDSEKKQAKKYGARAHPMSGAGKIKDDASDEDWIYEYKDAVKTHTLSAAALNALLCRAEAQGKDAAYVIKFDNGVTMEGLLFHHDR